MTSTELWFNSSNSDSDSSDDLEIISLRRRKIRDKANPLEMANQQFRAYYRISKDLFRYLIEKMEEKMTPCIAANSVPNIIKLTACLRFFAEGAYQKGVGHDLYVGLAQSTFSKCLSEMLQFFESEICPKEIKFPTSEEEINSIRISFYNKTGFPGVIGCVDGTHVRIFPPPHDVQHLYYNRKGFHSLNVMLICDHNLVVTYVDATHPGSCHDSFVWNGSFINKNLQDKYVGGDRSNWILGDAGYPLKPYLITPYRTSDDLRKTQFNTTLCSARIFVERTIGVIKNSFRCLMSQRSLHYKPEKATQIINAVCALHNLRIKFNMNLEEYQEQLPVSEQPNELVDEPEDELLDAGRGVRDEIMYSITHV